ncbi:uncharacterized protein [Haliotis asinina]|uniref:uncharacterized protein n=1 Tax=Haliotis asinina TaxID=109174 RepID=UPI0035323288
MSHHDYADDTQILETFHPSELNESLQRFGDCPLDIKSRMTTIMFKVNDTKTEALLVGTRQHLSKVDVVTLKDADADICPSDVVRNLGVHTDSSLTFNAHVNQVNKACFFHPGLISNIRQYLTSAATQALVRALVAPRLDYCNSVLSSINSNLIEKLQRIQNTSARFISRISKRAHITPVLIELHWLPV